MSMTFEMRLQDAPFQKIKTGRKTIELRLNDEKRRRISVGDEILFINAANGESLTAVVVALYPFTSFEALYRALPLEDCGYSKTELEGASASDMDAYYSREEQEKYGVLGIRIRLKD